MFISEHFHNHGKAFHEIQNVVEFLNVCLSECFNNILKMKCMFYMLHNVALSLKFVMHLLI